MLTIESLRARSILDSRGIPTIEATVGLSDGSQATASVPSGTSTGRHEAVELRDADPAVAGGKGVNRAVQNVTGEIFVALKGQAADLPKIDQQLIELDGTPNKHRLGANAILAVSLSLARALSVSFKQPLYALLASIYGHRLPDTLPVPLVNVFEGGRHADTSLSVQEFHFIPAAGETSRQIADVRSTYRALETILNERQLRVRPGYEGGFTAPLPNHAAVFETLVEAIERARTHLSLGIDAAASEFFDERDKLYHLAPEAVALTAEDLCSIYQSWRRSFPLRLIEDPVGEDDWSGWESAVATLGSPVQLIGDDFLTTNPQRIKEAFARGIRVGVLLKPNQIGTITETVKARALAGSGVPTVVSNRSGETLDAFIADFAVALGVDYLKAGGPFAPERAAKYDRLAAIAEELHAR